MKFYNLYNSLKLINFDTISLFIEYVIFIFRCFVSYTCQLILWTRLCSRATTVTCPCLNYRVWWITLYVMNYPVYDVSPWNSISYTEKYVVMFLNYYNNWCHPLNEKFLILAAMWSAVLLCINFGRN